MLTLLLESQPQPTLTLLITSNKTAYLRGISSTASTGLQWLPSANLFGCSAADWSRPATNKSKSSERKKKCVCVLLRKEIMDKLVVDLLQKGLAFFF